VAPYSIHSFVPIEVFRDFISALDDGVIEITNSNCIGLSLLCAEFGFEALAARVSEFRSSASFVGAAADGEARLWIAALEQRGLERDRETAALQAEVARLSAAVEFLQTSVNGSEVQARALRGDQARIEAEAARLCTAVEGLREELLALKPQPTSPSSRKRTSSARMPPNIPTVPPCPVLPPQAPAGFASLIVADFPALFTEFRGKSFKLLWRGSRDGFGAGDFHGRCDGHAPTLTLIQDTRGNIFGGFTPVDWESQRANHSYDCSNCFKADPSLKSFLFTLNNPQNCPARKFTLKAQRKDKAIICDYARGPHFHDIAVSDSCNAKTSSYTYNFGLSYANDTGLNGRTFFTGSERFTVKEIEVFEITD
jgi:hypothetical protein